MSAEEEIAAIRSRLATLATERVSATAVAAELGQIRAQLRALAETNEEVGQRLGELLGLRQPQPPPS